MDCFIVSDENGELCHFELPQNLSPGLHKVQSFSKNNNFQKNLQTFGGRLGMHRLFGDRSKLTLKKNV